MKVDVAIIGAGPAGLCLARALSGSGLSVVVLERQSEPALSNPAFDGREIALTHPSFQLMRELGLWEHIDSQAISPLRDARILNGTSLVSLNIDHSDARQSELGYLVSNYLIRKAAYEVVKASSDIILKADTQVAKIQHGTDGVQITLGNGESVQTRLLVGADSRFSETRRAMGIGADIHDFGKTMMVCMMEHDASHQHVAWEWFDYGQTLALLPMNGLRSSIVITLPAHEIGYLMELPEKDFNRDVEARFRHRLGAMRLVSTRHVYPMVTVYSNRLVGQRFALVGDAAVGMHPVTAHGFNFGLKGIVTLSREIKAAHVSGKDIAAPGLLLRYERIHRKHTRPLFLATHAIAKLYGNDTPPARLLRVGALRMGSRIKPIRRAVAGFLKG
jgi:ubiquinone biosynthesis UbiH/UbiF/VisC/COQ6 family hydroxylase